MPRAILLIMDSFGIGGAPDAADFGDHGANTLGHIAKACASGKGDRAGLRSGLLRMPNLDRLGLGRAAQDACGTHPAGLDYTGEPSGAWGHAREISHGKDTPSGHWEIAGVPVLFDWGYFPRTIPCFPVGFVSAFLKEAALGGLLGNKHASGTEIIAELGEEHIRTGFPICYTSGDSVFQIAAHEEHFGLQRLYEICRIARGLLDDLNIGRVIARPFIGESAATFERTANRRDYSVLPPAPTLLDRAKAAGREVWAIGKIADIYAHQGPTKVIKVAGNEALHHATLDSLRDAPDGALIITNFVDFDMLFGHRRDVPGYAAALEAFDSRFPDLEAALQPGDLAIITADHGCDPTWRGSDHTRERVPVLAFGPEIKSGFIGARSTFADIGETLAKHIALKPGPDGVSFL